MRLFFFFKQKTAYEIYQCDWSSDVCSSDLIDEAVPGSGLGLSIVRDIAELYGGSVYLSRAPLGGLRATLILPAAES